MVKLRKRSFGMVVPGGLSLFGHNFMVSFNLNHNDSFQYMISFFMTIVGVLGMQQLNTIVNTEQSSVTNKQA